MGLMFCFLGDCCGDIGIMLGRRLIVGGVGCWDGVLVFSMVFIVFCFRFRLGGGGMMFIRFGFC